MSLMRILSRLITAISTFLSTMIALSAHKGGLPLEGSYLDP